VSAKCWAVFLPFGFVEETVRLQFIVIEWILQYLLLNLRYAGGFWLSRVISS